MANCGGMQWGRQSHSLKILKNFEIAALGVWTHLLFWLAHFLGKQPGLYVCGCFSAYGIRCHVGFARPVQWARGGCSHLLNDPKILTGYFVSADSHRVRQVESGLLRAFAQWEFSCSGIKRRKQVKLFFSRRNFFELAYSKHW
jgi:hypothetical protein